MSQRASARRGAREVGVGIRGQLPRQLDLRQQAAGYLKDWFGWQDTIDLGDITTARGPEMLLPIWVRLWSALGTPMFKFEVVR